MRFFDSPYVGLLTLLPTQSGFTVILVERGEGVETKAIKTSYSSTAGTAFITFDNVLVPVENTLGPEGGGLLVILRCVSDRALALFAVRLECN